MGRIKLWALGKSTHLQIADKLVDWRNIWNVMVGAQRQNVPVMSRRGVSIIVCDEWTKTKQGQHLDGDHSVCNKSFGIFFI